VVSARRDSDAWTGALWRPGLPPGLYEERLPAARPGLVRLDTAAFIGLAERGPVNTPVLLTSAAAYSEVFGAPAPGLQLPQAVGAFFTNGGRRLIVVRALDHLHARTTRLILPGLDVEGGGQAEAAARNPGAWGDRLTLRIRARRRALPLRLAGAGDPDWPVGTLLAPAQRARAGLTLRLYGNPGATGEALIARIAAVKTVKRGAAAIALDIALPAAFDGPALLAAAEEVTVRLDLALGDAAVETWDDAALHPDHPNFLPRLLGRRAVNEALLPPKIDGGLEPDSLWGGDDQPAGSAFVRPSLALMDTWLKPSEALIAAPDGLAFTGAEGGPDEQGFDAADTTERAVFLAPTRTDPAAVLVDTGRGLRPFGERPGALDALAMWDERRPFEPVALVVLPDLIHPSPAEIPDEPALPAEEPCFGVCVHTPIPSAPPALPYPELGKLDDLVETAQAAIAHAEAIGGRIVLFDLPQGLTPGEIVERRRALASDRAALFAPWLRAADVDDPLAPAVLLPPAAVAAGLVARAELETGVYASPGGRAAAGVFGLAEDPGLPSGGFLHAERTNAFRLTEKGVELLGSRTTALDPDWTHISVRRIVDWLKAQIAQDLAWATFEPNAPPLWRAMARTADRRLRGLLDAGALAGRTASESYFVRCDATTTTQGDTDAGRAVMLIGVAPAVPAEFLVFRLVRDASDAVREAAA
jgi:hypothetical protein